MVGGHARIPPGPAISFREQHFPAYGTAKALPEKRPIDTSRSLAIREHWLPHLERYGVTAVFKHDHHNDKPPEQNLWVNPGSGSWPST